MTNSVTTTTKTPEQLAVSATIALKIAELGYNATFVEPISVGPVVSIYRFLPKGSTKVKDLELLAQDFALALGVEDVLVKRMPGEVAVGIWVPNKERKTVYWRDICQLPRAEKIPLLNKDLLSFWQVPLLMGIDHLGNVVVDDLTLLPHLLVAGSTGGGKSTWMSSAIATLIFNYSPDDIQLILIDLKHVEFNHFAGERHLLFEPCYTVYQALERLDWCIEEMESRLKRFAKQGQRNILEYNAVSGNTHLAYIVIVIDELASLLCDTRKEGDEDSPQRGPTLGKLATAKLAQLTEKARATGIHIIAATQRPSVKIVEGNIKANFPARLSFKLVSQTDSRTVLDTTGAEHLLNRGDMLFLNPNRPGLQRIHAPIASLEDIKAAVEYANSRRG